MCTKMSLSGGAALVVGAITGFFMLQWIRSVANRLHAKATTKTDGDLLKYIRGDFLDPEKCEVEWGWEEPIEVGHAVSFKVKFFRNCGQPFPISAQDNITVKISSPRTDDIVAVTTFPASGPNPDEEDINVLKVSFTVLKSATYVIEVKQNGESISKSPFTKTFTPGLLSPYQTMLTRTSHAFLSVVTMTVDRNKRLVIDARDEFDNKCACRLNKTDLETKFELRVRQASDPTNCPAFTYNIRTDESSNSLLLDVMMYEDGCFKALLTYDHDEIQNGSFEILVLNSSQSDEANGYISKRDLSVSFECKLLSSADAESDVSDEDISLEGSSRRKRIKSSTEVFASQRKAKLRRSKTQLNTKQPKLRKVYCYLTPKQLVIKEYFLLIIPKRLFTFRVGPSTRILCGDIDSQTNHPTFEINDGVQDRVLLACNKRNVLLATFVGIIYSNMGGQSSTFEAKLNHFYQELRKHYPSTINRSVIRHELSINRHDLLNTSFLATKKLSDEQWRNSFIIHFQSEVGIDWGGLSREWFHLLCKALFEARSAESNSGGSGLFRSLKDDPQALVLPNPSKLSGFKLRYYEFAGKIVGKCLYDSTGGGQDVRLVTARFARSFLAQLIGLPINYNHFASDDRELYSTKVKHIIENDVTDMELTFSEEIYINGALTEVVDLIPNGSTILVTEENKRKYLNRLAQYRLSESIKEEVEYFIKGLTSIVPDTLLSVFDENELELVMCGSSDISLKDMKDNSTWNTLPAYKADWFWAVLSSFTQDDMAKLLQFTTGCAQLPPEGVRALEPKLEITNADFYDKASLPTAHTCFNRLCIPPYDSYEDMRRMLKIAITEGATGFGLS